MPQLTWISHKAKPVPYLFSVLFVLASSVFSSFGDAADATVRPDITIIDGFRAPEDIDILVDADALIISGYTVSGNGDLRVFHPESGKIDVVYEPSIEDFDSGEMLAWGAPNCPGPPLGFAPHGIHVSQNGAGTYTLLAVNHTSREAVEWFEIEPAEDTFTAKWRGCVLVDEPYWINDVAALPDGGFVASHMMPRELASEAFKRQPNDGIKSGYVIEWQKDRGWTKVPGTEGALPNGVQVSHDGSVVYSNHYLGNQIIAVERASGKLVWAAAVDGAPDNLSLAANGSLLAVTHLESIATIGDCLARPDDVCAVGFVVYQVNATDGKVSEIFRGGNAYFGGATVAVELGDRIYLGTPTGSSMGQFAR